MKVLITGASSGIGRDMAYYLASLGHDLILVARRKERMEEMKSQVNVEVEVIELDLLNQDNVFKLYEMTKDKNIDILINNAGFGLFGHFSKTDLKKELEMIDLNIKTYHILMKLFLQDFIRRDRGYILNVASSAGFIPGPRLATYYATKNYITKLTIAVHEELRRDKSNVHVSAFCPGPVRTEFTEVANGVFNNKGISSEYASRYAIDKMFKNKMIIVPTMMMKIGLILARLVPYKLINRLIYRFQKRKEK